ncbi:MAG: 2OG-Fe(II) oxygenase [Myxococcales bacterium]|nr:2OG-Fe(II) oxygenase [Myxococcales bacterium]
MLDEGAEGLAAAGLSAEPFPHAITLSLFEPAFAERLLAWLEEGAIWVEQASHFYVQHACANLRRGHAAVIDELLEPAAIGQIQAAFAGIFGGEFVGAHVTVSAHRLLEGEGIGIHTDAPVNGTETHRLVVHLRRAFDDSEGGHLFLFRGPEAEDLAAIVRPHHNSAVAFELSERSWHAVNDVRGGARYSLIFGLWRVGAPCEHEGGAHGQRPEEEPLLDLLCRLGAHQVPHSGRALLDHLLGTSRLLRRWGCDGSVCLAGGAHSLYGTPGFRKALLGPGDRGLLRAVIGARAERLAWLFGHVDRSGLGRAMRGEAGVVQREFESGEVIEVSDEELRDLAALSWANTLEQDLALGARGEPAPGGADLARILDETAHALPERARAELRSAYDG